MTRVAVITGIAGGIGRACAVAFAADGWRVAGIDKGPRPANVASDWYAQIDLSSPETAERLKAYFADVGRIDALVNNAALHIVKSIADTTDAEWADVMATNASAPFVAIREALPLLQASGGAVVNVSSVHAVATSPGVAAYAASKGALLALTRAAALELGPVGVRVNAVLPGSIDTAMLNPAADARADLARRTPLGRIGRPDEVAGVVVLLADGTRSSFVTGQGWIVDGGVMAMANFPKENFKK